MDRLLPLSDHTVHIIYDKKKETVRNGLPRVRSSFDSIKEQKNRILKLGSECGETFFIMQDSDIQHLGNGIESLITFARENPETSAVGLWPHGGKVEYSMHVSNACMIIKSEDVKDLTLDYKSGCFCGALAKYLRDKGLDVRYLDEPNLIKQHGKKE